MSNTEDRIKQLEDLREKVVKDDKPVSHKSYAELLDYHIALLKEVNGLVLSMKYDDMKAIKEWYDSRTD